MSEVTVIGVDLAKRVFQLHGAHHDGSVVFRKKLSRDQFLAFVAQQPKCVIAMEACATAHGWGREFEKLGHDVRLIPPVYVKPFVKRQKNDVADAEAIVEAALRPTMRFVAVKSEDQQARAMLFRTRQMFVGQRTQMINALRGHLAEHGLVAARGPAHIKTLADAIADGDTALHPEVRDLSQIYLEQIEGLNARVAELDAKMRCAAKKADSVRRAQTMPGVGPVTALATPAMGCRTGLHRNSAFGLLAHKCKKLNTRQFLTKNNGSVCASPVKFKHALYKVYADYANF